MGSLPNAVVPDEDDMLEEDEVPSPPLADPDDMDEDEFIATSTAQSQIADILNTGDGETDPSIKNQFAGIMNEADGGTSSSVKSKFASFLKSAKQPWDPFNCSDWNSTPPTATCLRRVRRDLGSFYDDPPLGVFMVPDDDINTLIHALVIGPYDTPYEGGFFYFVLRCPPDYPIRPPRVRLLTTGDDNVRFNPNLYRDGKVCLSILGTWNGPAWSPAQSLTSVLISIQSLLCETPYHNEPGYDKEHQSGDAKRYNDIIEHETVRVAVCGVLEDCYKLNRRCPAALVDVIKRSFPQYYDHYIKVCQNLLNLQGTPMVDPFGDRRGKFEPGKLIERLNKLKGQLCSNECDDQIDGNVNGATSSSDDPSTSDGKMKK